MTFQRSTLPALAIATLALGGCGGGGSDSAPAAASSVQLQGLAANGAAIPNAPLTAVCASGPALTTTTAADGTFTVTLTDAQALPCMLSVQAAAVTLHSLLRRPAA